MKNQLLIFSICFLYINVSTGQGLKQIQDKIVKATFIEKESEEKYIAEYAQMISEIKELVDYEYYNTKINQASIVEDDQLRIDLLREVRIYPYWQINNLDLNKRARDLYIASTKRLIREYRGNIKELNALSIYPAYHAELYPFLKMEIEFSGGVWERGTIPKPNIYPPIKSNNNDNK